ncbi:uncharacterized protein VTP21DRAFT_7681 [Calcarisporiella thermophila]|uniref:uncharacterized protein n=1 Tax=Calcarisporiella thermophila TaxID=911321 RepID=UPI003743199A
MRMAEQQPGNLSEDLIEKIAARFNFIKKPVMTIAQVLDPNRSAFNFKDVSLGDIEQFLSERYPQDEACDIYTELLLFNSRSAPFDSPLIWAAAKEMDPILWWKVHTSLSPELAKLAITVLSMSATAAVSERIWSDLGFIHSGIWNRSKNPKLFKLVNIYSSLRLQNGISDPHIWFTEEELEEGDCEDDLS